jgi:hypothetical protein
MVCAVARLVPLALVTVLAGCSTHRTVDLAPGPEATVAVTPTPTVTDTPTPSATDVATAAPSVAPTPDGSLTNGKHPAYVTAVDAANRTVTVDVVQFFTGTAATEAARQDGSAEVPPPNDYWIRNANKLLRTLPVATDTTITVNTLAGETSGDPTKDVTVDLNQLAGYTLANHLFWITVDGATITKIAEQFLP